MANIKKVRANKSQNVKRDKPARATRPHLRASTVKHNAAETKQRYEAAPAPRMALVEIKPTNRQEMIEVAAYYRAEKRRFTPGGEVGDWLEAEKEIDRLSRLT